jgi:hypothetical protein
MLSFFRSFRFIAVLICAFVIPSTAAVPSSPFFVVSPKHQGFGKTPVNTQTAPQTFTFTNKGPNGVITGGYTTLSNNSDFFLINDTCSLIVGGIPSGGTCTVQVFFRPSSTGRKTSTLSITGTDNVSGAEETPTANLTGTGT